MTVIIPIEILIEKRNENGTLMPLVTTVMYMHVTVTATVCNRSSDDDEAYVDAPEISQKTKRGNVVLLVGDIGPRDCRKHCYGFS